MIAWKSTIIHRINGPLCQLEMYSRCIQLRRDNLCLPLQTERFSDDARHLRDLLNNHLFNYTFYNIIIVIILKPGFHAVVTVVKIESRSFSSAEIQH
jgi:hypothetical protein